MSKDKKNVFQLTPIQLRKKIREYERTKANSRIETVGRRALRPACTRVEKMDAFETEAMEVFS